MHLQRIRPTLIALIATLTAAAGVGTNAYAGPAEPTPLESPQIAAVTFADEFNGPAGTPRRRREVAAGDRRQRQQPRAAVLHEPHQQRGPRRPGQPGHHRPPGEPRQLPVLVRHAASTPPPGSTPRASSRQTYGRFEARIKIPRGQGMWPAFWMLGNDIGDVGWPQQRRDRHHGERRLRAEHRARHPARPRLLGRRRHRRRLHAAGGRVRRRLPHLHGRLGAEPDHLVRRRQRLPDAGPRPTSAATSGSSTTRSS